MYSSQPTSQGDSLACSVSQETNTKQGSSRSQALKVVREESTAQGIGNAETSNFVEGRGLIESAMHKVTTSFLSRLDHFGGSSEDMGYNYFMEKVGLLVWLVSVYLCQRERECVRGIERGCVYLSVSESQCMYICVRSSGSCVFMYVRERLRSL